VIRQNASFQIGNTEKTHRLTVRASSQKLSFYQSIFQQAITGCGMRRFY